MDDGGEFLSYTRCDVLDFGTFSNTKVMARYNPRSNLAQHPMSNSSESFGSVFGRSPPDNTK